MLDKPVATCMGKAEHLAVAGGVFNGVFLCCPFFQLDVLDEIWDVIESVSEGFLTYSFLFRRKRLLFYVFIFLILA